MRIVLCDDDKAFIQQLDKTLQEYFQEIHTKCPEIACFYSGEALLADTGAKDIVFSGYRNERNRRHLCRKCAEKRKS